MSTVQSLQAHSSLINKKKSDLTPFSNIVHLGARSWIRMTKLFLPAKQQVKFLEGGKRNLAEVSRPHAPVGSIGANNIVHGSNSLGPLPHQAFTMDSFLIIHIYKGSRCKSRYSPQLREVTKLEVCNQIRQGESVSPASLHDGS